MIIKVLLIVVAIIAIILVVASFQPNDCRHTRSAVIDAPPATIFAHVNDFHQWPAWSPYEKLDPGMKRSYSGPPAGVGTSYAWEGNNQVGAGSVTIKETTPNELIVISLVMTKPFACDNRVEFAFKPEGKGTVVSWTMSGKNHLLGKVMGLFMNMDKMVGGQFEEGLANLKRVVEAEPKVG